MKMDDAHRALVAVGTIVPATTVTVLEQPRDKTQALACLEHYQRLLANVQSWEEAWKLASAVKALERALIGLNIGKTVVADAAELLIWAKCRVGELLGKRGRGAPVANENAAKVKTNAPSGAIVLDRNERQRCRELAKVKASLPRWLADSRKKYLANQDRPPTPRKAVEALLRRKGDGTGPRLWKPSDVWNFTQLAFDKLADNQDLKSYGYIPGEIYANIFAYWSRPGDVVVAPMAGSGMIFHVYEERHRWMGDEPWEVDLRGADLNPWGLYADRIAKRDAIKDGIEGPADLIVIDIPYFRLVAGQYSKDPADLANIKDLDEYDNALHRLALSCRKAQRAGGRAVIIAASAYVDHETRQEVQISVRILDAFRRAGYALQREVSSPRRIQQTQNPRMAILNNLARERRLMLSEDVRVQCFVATDSTFGEAELLAAWDRASEEQRDAFVEAHAPELRRLLDGRRP
jgi:hypothetical protein